MGFRLRHLLGFGSAVLITALVYGALGYAAFQRSLARDLAARMEAFRRAAASSLVLEDERPFFRPDAAARAVLEEYGTSRFRVLQGDRVVFEFGGSFPVAGADWERSSAPLADGSTLELALWNEEARSARRSYLRTSALALPPVLAVALALAWLLQRLLLRPLRDLQRAARQLSRQARPAPVEVPPGDDELSRLAESFNRMAASVHAAFERERSFTRYASHELRTPLSTLRVLVEGARRGVRPDAELWNEALAALDRAEAVLAGLLTLTRAPRLRPEPIPLELVAADAVAALPAVERTRVALHTDPDPPIVLAQEDLLAQVLANLLGNALAHGAGAVELRLETDLRRREGALRVRDHGAGVPAAKLASLTEPFVRLDGARDGLGLGLALVRHAVEAMGGRLELRNAEPGLEAFVALPLAEEAPPEGLEPRTDVSGRSDGEGGAHDLAGTM